jgi:hypothetical protein
MSDHTAKKRDAMTKEIRWTPRAKRIGETLALLATGAALGFFLIVCYAIGDRR